MTDDKLKELVIDLCDGNPGGLTVLMASISEGSPETPYRLRDLGIRGSDIWVLFKDVCGENIGRFITAVAERAAAA